jgi:hypothetical protein
VSISDCEIESEDNADDENNDHDAAEVLLLCVGGFAAGFVEFFLCLSDVFIGFLYLFVDYLERLPLLINVLCDIYHDFFEFCDETKFLLRI